MTKKDLAHRHSRHTVWLDPDLRDDLAALASMLGKSIPAVLRMLAKERMEQVLKANGQKIRHVEGIHPVEPTESGPRRHSMQHRHLNHQEYTLAAIDDIISRGQWQDWTELREAMLAEPEIMDKVERISRARLDDDYEAQRYHFWANYVAAHRGDKCS